jgi:predicted TPR repeat methyltransferase
VNSDWEATGTRSGEPYETRKMREVAARWDAKAESWDRQLQDPLCHLNEDGAYDRFIAAATNAVEKRLGFCTAQGVVDAGCATGLVLAKVIDSFAWGIGVDISPQMIRVAQGKGIPRAKFYVGDCFSLPGICPRAGVVLSRGVLLSHYGRKHAGALLCSARASLVREGFILWDFLNQGGKGNYQHSTANKTYFEPEEVRTMAIQAGFHFAETLGAADRRVGLLFAEGV